MAFVIEQFGIRTASGDPMSAEIPYAVWGAPTSEIARAMAVAASPATYTVNAVPLFRKQATVEEKGPESHIINIAYGPIKPPEERDRSSRSTRPVGGRRSRRACRRFTATPRPAKRPPTTRGPSA